ncbi:hypothetical protein H6P81_006215 [Aristolochia fimbriata]|uniref:Reverse transcriptase n=1 Tax=Aristolochia fimbriata TaxID=158543 RepID=A0AAV7EZH9_ARIFI|nr:hypothetical protein H6P81_006215 [Aristolochia fimbriata]
MMTQAKTVEEQLAEIQAPMRERDEQLRERELQRDLQIATILQKFEQIADRRGAPSQPEMMRDRLDPKTSGQSYPSFTHHPLISSSRTPGEPGTTAKNRGHYLTSRKPRDFQELATEAHNMEILIQEKGEGKAPLTEADKKPKFVKKEYKAPTKEALATNIAEPQKITATQNKGTGSDWKLNANRLANTTIRQKFTLKNRQAKTYPFPDSDIPGMLEQLLEKNLLQLPEAMAERCWEELRSQLLQVPSTGRPSYRKMFCPKGQNTRVSDARSHHPGIRRQHDCFPHHLRPTRFWHQNGESEDEQKNLRLAHWTKTAIRRKRQRRVGSGNPQKETTSRSPRENIHQGVRGRKIGAEKESPEEKRRKKAQTQINLRQKFLTPTPALVATCSPQVVEQRREGKAPIESADDIHTCLQDLSITNEVHDDLDLPIRSRQALIKFVAAKDDWHAEVEQLRMRRHDEPKIGLSPSKLKEEQPSKPPQIKEAHSISISFKEADMLLSGKSLIIGLCSFYGYQRPMDQPHILDSGSAVNIPANPDFEKCWAGGQRPPSQVVPSTLHQCFKYYQDGEEKTVFADECPFTEAEASFADAKYYLEEKGATSSKAAPPKAVKGEQAKPKKQPEEPILRYVLQSRRKKGESPFTICDREEPAEKLKALKDTATIPLPKLNNRGILVEERNPLELPKTRTQGFDPNAYRMMAKAGSGLSLEQLQEKSMVAVQNLSPTQKSLQAQEKRGKRKTPNQIPPLHVPRKKLGVFRGAGENRWSNPKEQSSKDLGHPHGSLTTQRLGKVGGTSSKRIKSESSEVTPVVIYISSKKKDPEEEEEVVAVHHISADEGNDSTPEDDLGEAPAIFEEGGKATIDQLKKVNLGTEDDPRPTFLSASLSVTEEKDYMSLISEYKDVFAWSYTEMPGLDPTIAIHKLAIKSGVKPIKQSQRRFRPELVPEIEKEVDKLLKADFIRKDLNKACPKDDFPLPITELMVDATTGHEALSFMDGSFGYNQIRMDPKDEEKTAFRTPKGIFCYKVMPFGLKNAGATYQRAMQKIFDDFLHKFVECYVDDVVVKTKSRGDHLRDLRAVIERLRRHQLKMNPLKCAFGVSSGKFLGFVVRLRGIEIDQTKIDAIQQMPEPKTLSELKILQGHLAYIRRFISNLVGRCQPFSHLMKKDTPFEWDESCRRAFQNIKNYRMKPPVLMAPTSGKPLLLYIAAQEKSLGALLAQNDDKGKERPLYYLSRTMVGAELNYSPIEKTCLALIFAIQKLRHYLLAHSTNLISRADPLKFIMSRPMLSGRLAKWALLLSEFEINFIPQKAIKGQGLANFLADHPIPAEWEPARNLRRFGSGDQTDNRRLRGQKRRAHAVSKRGSKIAAKNFKCSLGHVPRARNSQADALAGIAASLAHFEARPERIPICERWVVPTLEKFSEEEEINLVSVYAIEEEDWRQQFLDYLEHKKFPEELKARVYVRRVAPKFCLFNNTLYRRSYDGILLRCVSKEEGQAILAEAHGGICGAHQAGPKLHLQVKQLGYYWPTMLRDAIELARHCTTCQLHANYIHQPPSPLHPTRPPGHFRNWGMDIIGPINPKSPGKSPKQLYKEIKAATVVDFIRTQIVYRYGVPRYIMTDNGTPFRNKTMDNFCEKFASGEGVPRHTTLPPMAWRKPSTKPCAKS